MPCETYWEDEGIRAVFRGTVTDDEFFQGSLKIYEDERFPAIRYQLVDVLLVEDVAVSSNTIRRVAAMDKEQSARNPNVRVAVVARTPLIRGLSRMYELSSGETSWVTQLFETEAEARSWLDS